MTATIPCAPHLRTDRGVLSIVPAPLPPLVPVQRLFPKEAADWFPQQQWGEVKEQAPQNAVVAFAYLVAAFAGSAAS